MLDIWNHFAHSAKARSEVSLVASFYAGAEVAVAQLPEGGWMQLLPFLNGANTMR